VFGDSFLKTSLNDTLRGLGIFPSDQDCDLARIVDTGPDVMVGDANIVEVNAEM
jgi:hypothetical protein